MNPPSTGRPPPLPRNARSRRLTVWLILGILLLPPAGLIIWYGGVRMSNAAAVRKLERQCRDRGEPVTLVELKTMYPPVAEEENAAVVLMDLWEADDPNFWQAFANEVRPLPQPARVNYDPWLPFLGSEALRVSRVGPLDSRMIEAADIYLTTKADHLRQARAALQRPRFWFPINIEDGPEALLPHLGHLKTEAQNFQIVALLSAERGDKGAAIEAVRNTAQTGQLLAEEPILISQLVRLACLNIVLDEIEQLLSRQTMSANELNELTQFVESISLRGKAQIPLIYERPFLLCLFDPSIAANSLISLEDEATDPDETARNVRVGYGLFESLGLMEVDRRLMLETFQEAIRLAELETPESLREIDELFENASKKARKLPPKMISALTLPAIQKVPSRFARYEARRRACLTALALEQYRLRHTQMPDSLEKIISDDFSAIPLDPFTGEPLRFRQIETGYVVYSVGSDLEDNGGNDVRSKSAKQTDATFIVE